MIPSQQYDSLTLNESGNDYTAPADGWFSWNGSFSTNGRMKMMEVTLSNSRMCNGVSSNSSSNTPVGCCIPVAKGNKIRILYNNIQTTDWFVFIYAKSNIHIIKY